MKASIYAKVMSVGDIMEGKTRDGNDWKKRTVVVSENGSERKLAIDFMGEDRIKQLEGINAGDMVIVTIDVYSRDYVGKWYTTIDGYSLRKP